MLGFVRHFRFPLQNFGAGYFLHRHMILYMMNIIISLGNELSMINLLTSGFCRTSDDVGSGSDFHLGH